MPLSPGPHPDPAAPTIIAGLGNPGTPYEGSLHNLGRDWVRALGDSWHAEFAHSKRFAGQLAKANVNGHRCSLYLPDCQMNETGPPLAYMAGRLGCSGTQLLVVHDEMDLPAGTARLKFGGGDAGHKGLRSIRIHLATGEYWRLRLGIGHAADGSGGREYVLSRPPPQQREPIEAAMRRSLALMGTSVGSSWDEIIRQLHSPPPPPSTPSSSPPPDRKP